MNNKEAPKITFDYRSFVSDNMTPQGCFKDGGAFDGAFSCWWNVWDGRGKTYSFTLNYCKWVGKKPHSFYVTISQQGIEVDGDDRAFSFDEIFSVVSRIQNELEKYAFKPVAYELWSDHPETPYYIPEGKRSLCNKVVSLFNAEGEIT